VNRGIVRIPLQRLVALLDLPEATHVEAILVDDWDRMTRTFRVLIRHPNLPPVPEGGVPPVVDLRDIKP